MNKKYNLSSNEFKLMLADLDLSILNIIASIYTEDFDKGDINLKISINLNEEFIDEQRYRKPVVNYSVITTLKQQSKIDGIAGSQDNIILKEDGFYLQKIPNPQINLEDIYHD